MSDVLSFRAGVAHVEGVALPVIADRCGTPTYVYSRAHFTAQYAALDAALSPLPHQICYAVKANSNLAVLKLFGSLGAGFDIVSGGELERVVRAGGNARDVIFSGVGKSGAEIDFALKLDIGCFNVESTAELERIETHARRLARRARISVRVNPDIDAGTHPYISTGLKTNKFGVPHDEALSMYRHASNSQWLDVVGIDCHIGSQIATPGPLLEALRSLLRLVDQLEAEGIRIEHLDLGGGFGVVYRDEPEFDVVGVRDASEASAARARVDAARGTRPLPRRKRRRAADARGIPEARGHERPTQFRDPRRGDERFDSPDAVPGVASDPRGRNAGTRCASRPLGSRGSRLRVGRFPRPRS